MEKEIIYYYKTDGSCPYFDWYKELDKTIQSRINRCIKRLEEDGLYGDHKKLQKSELSELRMDFGKGYRIYYYDLEDAIILFIAGSDKSEQKKVIQQANNYFEDYLERNVR